jgi:hypothetical protein
MTIIPFPKIARERRGPVPIFVCAPLYVDMEAPERKFGLGYSREAASTRFYEGGQSRDIETKIFSLATAPKWLKFHIVSQFLIFLAQGQPLSPVDQETRDRLGDDPYRYGEGPGKKKRKR